MLRGLITGLVGVASIGTAATATAAPPISALEDNTFSFRLTRTPNLSGFGIGDRLAFGIDFVTPNPESAPFDGGNDTRVVGRQGSFEAEAVFIGNLFPGEYFRSVPFDSALTGQWELTISNPGSTNSPVVVNTAAVGDAGTLEFVTDVSISPDGTTPTFKWALPGTSDHDRQTVLINDLNRPAQGGGALIIHRATLAATETSFSVPSVLSNGESLELGGKYEIVLRLDEFRPPEGIGFDLASRSSNFFAFSPLVSGGADVFIPSVGPDGVFNFDLAVEAGFPVILDPFVATGYVYEIGAGDPLFETVKILTDVGDGLYELLFDFGGMTETRTLAVDELFSFLPFGGVSSFTIQGIETSAGLDPADTTAFMTEVFFATDGRFTGTMTPIVTAVPEPSVLSLFLIGLLGLGFVRRYAST